MSNITRIDDSAKGKGPQGVAAKRQFASQDIVIESVAERIANRWADGALELHLSIEYRVRRAFVEAVLRRESPSHPG